MNDGMSTSHEATRPTTGELSPATLDDVATIRVILQEASDYKMSRGDDLWGETPFTDEEVAGMVQTGNMFVSKIEGATVASVLLTKNDERMWGDGEGGDDSAVYVHKLCVSNASRGQGVGNKVMELAEDYARATGKTRLRLDCPYDNRPLCEYYERLGFGEIRRYDRPLSAGRRNPDKDMYRVALYQKELEV